MIIRDRIEDVLSTAWSGLRLAGEPQVLTGGFWARMWRVRVDGQPDGMPSEVVVRYAPHQEMGAKETEVQRAVAAQGYPTPMVWLSRADDEPPGGWWSVMDFATGAPLLAGLDGAGVLLRAPALVRRLPVQLADAMAALHRLHPEPVSDAVRCAAPGVAWSPGAVLDQLRLGAGAIDRRDLVAAIEQLADRMPRAGGEVVCHGDLHPVNVLAAGGQLTVLDWTAALLAHPCFDLALTELLLVTPPLDLPGPLAAVVRRAGASLARRFLARYAATNPAVSLDDLEWYRGLHSARILIDLTQLRAEHGPGAGGHPWRLVAPSAATNLTTTTGVAVHP